MKIHLNNIKVYNFYDSVCNYICIGIFKENKYCIIYKIP